MTKIISLKNISYIANQKMIIDSVSLDVNRYEVIALRGQNGAGKTTLLKLMYGLIQPTSGEITRGYETDICTSFIFQNPSFLNDTVHQNLYHALYCKNIPIKDRNDRVSALLKKYTLDYLSDKYIYQLSGGELQLVSLMRSLAIQPQIIFYDEPTNNLDQYNTNLILDALQNFIDDNNQLILVSHDDSFVDKLNCINIMLKDGRVANA